MTDELLNAKEYAEAENYTKAWPIVSKVLFDEPDNPKALCLAVYMLERQNSPAIAYQVCKRLTQVYPQQRYGVAEPRQMLRYPVENGGGRSRLPPRAQSGEPR